MRGVFIGREALAAGAVTRYELSRYYRRLYPDVYLSMRQQPSLRDRARGAWLWSGRHGVIAGVAASALHGARWVDDDHPVELVHRPGRPVPGLVVRSDGMNPDETTVRRGLPVTTVHRTAFDLGRLLPRDEAVARLDALHAIVPFTTDDVAELTERHRGSRGVRRLPTTLSLVDGGAESPKETWLRLLLIDAGFPSPTTQIAVIGRSGKVAWIDMGWEAWRLGVEYDGDHHRTDRRQYVKDQRRLRMLEAMGWTVIRVIAEDRPGDVVARVNAALVKARAA